jgi:hypothetical protein
MFELLLHFLEHRLWKEYDTPSENEKTHNVINRLTEEGDDKMKIFLKKLMEERSEEMVRIYKELSNHLSITTKSRV